MHIALARQHLWLDAQRFMTKLISLCLCGAGCLAGWPAALKFSHVRFTFILN